MIRTWHADLRTYWEEAVGRIAKNVFLGRVQWDLAIIDHLHRPHPCVQGRLQIPCKPILEGRPLALPCMPQISINALVLLNGADMHVLMQHSPLEPHPEQLCIFWTHKEDEKPCWLMRPLFRRKIQVRASSNPCPFMRPDSAPCRPPHMVFPLSPCAWLYSLLNPGLSRRRLV